MSKVTLNLSKRLFNQVYLKNDLLHNQNRYMVLMGGGGSGKSVFAAQKIIYRTLSEKPHRFLVLRKVQRTLRESVFMEFKKAIYGWKVGNLFHIPKGSSSELHIQCKANGNEILFAGLDDVEKLKSISGITGIWIEEASEIDPDDFRQLDIRLRGKTQHYKQMILSFNPISVTHWLKDEFFDKKKPGSFTLHTTYKDNKFLDDEAIKVLEGFKETDPYFYQVYALGEWGVIGKTIFNAEKVTLRINQLRKEKPLKRGYFTYDYVNERIVDRSIKWVNDDNGYISIYEEPKKVDEDGNIIIHPYVAGGDTAGDGSDYFGGAFLDNVTGKQVAVLHHQFDEDLYAKQMYCLGKYYNYALLAIEVNFSTYPVKELQRLGYARQYRREVIDQITNKRQEKYGFKTTTVTRPVIIAELVQVIRENVELIMDIPTLNEMLTFVRNEKGKPEAQEGKKDDLIMTLAIAHKAREQQAMVPMKQEYDEPEYETSFGRTGY